MLIDIIILAATVMILKINIEKWNRKVRILWITMGIILLIAYVSCFIVEYKAWHNFNAALFNISKPWITLVFSFIILVVFLTIQRIIETDKKEPSKGKIVNSIIVSIMLLITLFICPFVEIYSNNINEFSFSFSNIILPMIFGSVAVVFLLVYIYSLLNDCSKRVFLSLVWAVGIMSYFQGLLLNGNLFLMDGKEMEWSTSLVIGNLTIWVIAWTLLVALVNLKSVSKYSNKSIVYSSAFLALIQLVGLLSLIPNIFNNSKQQKGYEINYLSTQGINEVASGDNVVIFVLDTYDVDYYEEVTNINSNFYAPLSDFVFYKDTVSQFSRTYPSIPYMLSHKLYFFEESKKDYVDTAFRECSFWENLMGSGYSIYVYEDDKLCIGESLLSDCSNYSKEGHVLSEEDSFLGTIEAIMTIGGYRNLPYLAKSSLSYTSDSINKMVIHNQKWDTEPYQMDDARLIKSINSDGLKESDDDNSFRFIHLMGAHAPYVLDASGQETGDRIVEPAEQYQGCMQYVFKYIDELKKLGKYDDSTIIITADHGENFVACEIPDATNPILMIKYPEKYSVCGINNNMENGPKLSNARASLEDILPTIASLINIDYDGNGTGVNLLEGNEETESFEADSDRIRYHYFAVVENTKQTGVLKYEINGSSRDFSSWKNTGEYHKFGEYYE